MRVLTGFLLAIGVAAAACGGGDDDSSDGATPTATVDFQEAAEDAVQDALLTADDLPEGWTESLDDDDDEGAPQNGGEQDGGVPPAGVDEEDEIVGEFEEELLSCSGVEPDDEFEGQTAYAESPDFAPSDGSEGVSVEAYVFDTEDHAQDALDRLAQVFQDCSDVLQQLFIRGVQEGAEDEPDVPEPEVTSTFEERNTLELGDASRNFHIDARVLLGPLSFDTDVDLTLVRQGRMAGIMLYFTVKPGSERARIATAFADKLYRANLTLPPEADD